MRWVKSGTGAFRKALDDAERRGGADSEKVRDGPDTFTVRAPSVKVASHLPVDDRTCVRAGPDRRLTV